MNFKRIQTLGSFSPVHTIDMNCLRLIDCGDNVHFYVSDFLLKTPQIRLNFAPYYELVGTIIAKEPESDYIDYRVVTRSIFLFSKPKDAALGMPSVHIPVNWKEWTGYFTGKDWIFVEFPRSSNNSDYWSHPQILRRNDIHFPAGNVSLVHFAEDKKGTLFIVQAYDYNGIPVQVNKLDENYWHPVKILPRKKFEFKKGTMYAYSSSGWYVII